MKKRPLQLITLGIAATALLISCTKNGGGETPPPTEKKGKYVVLSSESGAAAAGYYTSYDNIPSGDLNNIATTSLQGDNYGGFRTYKQWGFKRKALTKEKGVVRFEVGASGTLEQTGFIKCGTSAQNLVVNETTGFYFDADRGKTKIQKFNPSTMQRTGEIDLSSLIEKGAGISTNVFTGGQTIMAKEGKLYADIDYARPSGSGHNDNTRNYTLAVIDIATGKPEKTIVFSGAKNQGHSPSEYPAWTQAPDGTLYILTTGWDYDETNQPIAGTSRVFRIKAGETDFDKNWVLNPADMGGAGNLFWSLAYGNGKLYVDFPDEKVNFPSFDNLIKNMYHTYAVDINTKKITKVSGAPALGFGYASGNLFNVNNAVYMQVCNKEAKYNGYYKINPDNTATPVFNITKGGKADGFSFFTSK